MLLLPTTHNLGASNVMKNVPRSFQKRLGLSAMSNIDTIGSEFINDYFGIEPFILIITHSIGR